MFEKLVSAGEQSDRKSNVIARRIMVGLVMTFAALMAYVGGLDEHLELKTLSLRQKKLARQTSIENIVNIDIDDASLENIGRWPWPREYIAGVAETLSRCGAKTILFDLIFPEPQQPRYVSLSDDMLNITRDGCAVKTPPMLKLDDLIFQRAIALANNVFLPIQIEQEDFFKPAQIELFDKVDSMPKNTSSGDFRQPFHTLTPNQISEVFLRYSALNELEKFSLNVENAGILKMSDGYLVPPFSMLTEGLAGTGYVNFRGDSDSVVRRISLLAKDSRDNLWPQIALAIAMNQLGGCPQQDATLIAKSGRLEVILPNGQTRRIPLDESGRMLLVYSRESWRASGTQGENHISIEAVANLWKLKRSLGDIRTTRMYLNLNFLMLGMADESFDKDLRELGELASQRDDLFEQVIAAKREEYYSRLFTETRQQEKYSQQLREKELEVTKKAQAIIAKLQADKNAYEEFIADEPEAAEAILNKLAKLPKHEEKLKAQIAEAQKSLELKVCDKICLIGSTSVGAADFVPTPLSSRTPGVIVHSNIINMFLQDKFLVPASWWVNFTAVFIAGFLATLLSTRFKISFVCVAVILLAVIYYFFNVEIVFMRWGVVLNMVAPILAMVLAFIGITAYRELTEERAKRHIKSMFAHALSPQLVNELLADPSIAQLGGQDRPITCMFTDLAGFTSLSEKLGPKQTVAVLNRYFDCVTKVVQEDWGGYINKFLGDGVFGFFGAPVAMDDHPGRSVYAAIDYQRMMKHLNESIARETKLPAKLSVRIGLTSDKAMVGNCGSSQRMDYTAIGNVVNLSARLEAANKFFGTKILAERNVLENADDPMIVARAMPKIFVNGVAESVRTFNVLGMRDEMSGDMVDAAAEFTKAVELIDQRRFQEALEKLEALKISAYKDDNATDICMELCKTAMGSDNPQTFQPADVNKGSVIRMDI